MPGRSNIVVVGSLNVDYIASVEHLPARGETIAAGGLSKRFGGKGANQAVAAARQGAKVSLIGCVGSDDEGRAYRRRLRQEGITTQAIRTSEKALTGTALIAVERSGENMIVVAPGANGELSPAHIRAERDRISAAGVVLIQFEIPMASVIETVRLANRTGVPVALNPSPLRPGFPWGRCGVDTVLANAGEAEQLFGRSVERLRSQLGDWRRALRARLIQRLIITRGAQTTVCVTAAEFFETPTLRVNPVDTVGAGDAFVGAFAARYASGAGLAEAIRCANCAGALATLKPGAQEASPSRAATARACRALALSRCGAPTL
jgi:ribokinase